MSFSHKNFFNINFKKRVVWWYSKEARGYGSISYRVYWEYLRAGGVFYLGRVVLNSPRPPRRPCLKNYLLYLYVQYRAV